MVKDIEFKLDRQFQTLFAQQTAEEVTQLEESLLANGCLDSLKVWAEEGILLDGHTRKKLCEKHDIEYRVETISLPSREMALQWVISNQLGRRNLTDEQRTYYMGKEYLIHKEASPSANGEANGEIVKTTITEAEAVEKVAEKYNASPSTVRRAGQYAEVLDELPVKERLAILSGKSKLPKQEVQKKAAPKYQKAKPKKSGKVRFPWPEFNKVASRFRRAIDEVAKAYDTKESNRHRSIRKSFNDLFDTIFTEWKQELEAKVKE